MAAELPTLTTLLDASFDGQHDGPAVLSAYASDAGSNAIWRRADEEIVDLFVEEAATVFPEVKRHIVGATVHRWDEGYPAWEPGHFGHLAELSAPFGHVHFSGDYLAIPSIEGAMGTALRAGEAVEELLGAGR